jgi:hypothetical protein
MPTILALAPEQYTLWRITLGIGAVVIVVVILLLTFLVKIVTEIDKGTEAVLNEALGVAENTKNLDELKVTLEALEAIKAEVILHDNLLRSLR